MEEKRKKTVLAKWYRSIAKIAWPTKRPTNYTGKEKRKDETNKLDKTILTR